MLIAELCQNHNGDKNLLERMISEAAKSGATHCKIQHIYSSNLTFRPEFETGLITNEGTICIKRPYQDEFKRLKSLELSDEDCKRFIEICKDFNLIPMTTCFSRNYVDKIKEIGFEVIKIASYDCSSFQLLREIANKFEHIVVSTGATFDNEIEKAAEILRNKKYTFLHCVTKYPTNLEDLNLARINWLKQFTNNVGFSDHSLRSKNGSFASMAAIAKGADSIECHFTVLNADQTKDGAVSTNPKQFEEIAQFTKLSKAEQIQYLNNKISNWDEITEGQAKRPLSHEELLNRAYYKGRFASPRKDSKNGKNMIFNWEEVSLDK